MNKSTQKHQCSAKAVINEIKTGKAVGVNAEMLNSVETETPRLLNDGDLHKYLG